MPTALLCFRLVQARMHTHTHTHTHTNAHTQVFLEDAGFDWKILGPDVPRSKEEVDYVAWQCDQDAYACSGQKCSAQSMLFTHTNWVKAGLYEKLAALASRCEFMCCVWMCVCVWMRVCVCVCVFVCV